MKTLFIINDPPYGSEKSYTAFRLANSLVKREGQEVKIYLVGDATLCAKKGQTLPQGFYNLEIMIKGIVKRGGEVITCGMCMEARGITESEITDGVKKGTLELVTDWTAQWADKVIVF